MSETDPEVARDILFREWGIPDILTVDERRRRCARECGDYPDWLPIPGCRLHDPDGPRGPL